MIETVHSWSSTALAYTLGTKHSRLMQSLFHHQLKYYYSLVVCSHFLVAELVRLLWIRNFAPYCCQSLDVSYSTLKVHVFHYFYIVFDKSFVLDLTPAGMMTRRFSILYLQSYLWFHWLCKSGTWLWYRAVKLELWTLKGLKIWHSPSSCYQSVAITIKNWFSRVLWSVEFILHFNCRLRSSIPFFL